MHCPIFNLPKGIRQYSPSGSSLEFRIDILIACFQNKVVRRLEKHLSKNRDARVIIKSKSAFFMQMHAIFPQQYFSKNLLFIRILMEMWLSIKSCTLATSSVTFQQDLTVRMALIPLGMRIASGNSSDYPIHATLLLSQD